MKNIFKFELNDEVYDEITGFSGVVITKSQWRNGCIRYNIQPRGLKECGRPIESEWFDEEQLVLVKKEMNQKEVNKSGGPQIDEKKPY